MFDNNGLMGEIIETGQSTVKSAGDAVGQGAKATVNSVISQTTGQDMGTNEAAARAQTQQKKMSDNQATDFLKSLYGKSDKSVASGAKPPQNDNVVKQALGIKPHDPNAGKTPEEIAKLQSLRQQLHSSGYYQPLINPPKQKEVSVAEKLDREKQEERWEEAQKQKEKPSPLATIKTGTGEKMVGASG